MGKFVFSVTGAVLICLGLMLALPSMPTHRPLPPVVPATGTSYALPEALPDPVTLAAPAPTFPLTFRVMAETGDYRDFDSFAEAVAYARDQDQAAIYFSTAGQRIWSSEELPDHASIDGVPLISQLPELERGCEVTSLAMILGFSGIEADKMTLAEQVKKDPTPFEIRNSVVYFGNPNDGFVGNMETFGEPGFGVYHGPIKELAEQYAPGQVIDMTGSGFDDVLRLVSEGTPVWVIDNLLYEPLDDDFFETWETPDGPINITYQEHSVVVTGFNGDTVALNDPIEGRIEVDRELFAAAWEQMGRQAIAVWKPDRALSSKTL